MALIDAGAELRVQAAEQGDGGERLPRWEDLDDPIYDSALHEAIERGRPLVVEALLEAGHSIDEPEMARRQLTLRVVLVRSEYRSPCTASFRLPT